MRRKVFLIDGVGALMSAIGLIALSTPMIHPFIGMPIAVLQGLFGMAVVFMCYSLIRYKIGVPEDSKWLKYIVFGNLSYCVVSAYFLVEYFNLLTTLGATYFILEKLIVLGVVAFELSVLRHWNFNDQDT